jgi:superkiller protein 3
MLKQKKFSLIVCIAILIHLLFQLFLPVFVLAKQYSPEVSALLAKGDEYLVNQDDPKEASKFYQEALVIEPKCSHAFNQLGLCYSHLGKLPESINEFKKALQVDPDFIPSLVNLGSAFYKTNKYTEAIEYYKKASRLRKDRDPEILANLASALRDRAIFEPGVLQSFDYDEAESLYKKAITINNNFAQAHNNYALLLLRQKCYEQAEEEVRKAIAIKKDYAMAYYNLGLIQEAKNYYTSAIESYRKSLKYETISAYKEDTRRKIISLGGDLNEANSDIIAKSYALILKKNWQQAESLLAKAIAGNERNNAIVWNNYGFVLAEQKKYDQAIKAYDKAKILMPSHFPAVHYNLGQLLLSQNNLAASEKALREAISQANGGHALAHNALAIVLKQQGDLKEAMEHYNLAISQSGNALPVVHFNRAILLQKQGAIREAIIEYKIYLDSSPNGYNARAARERLKKLVSNKN